MAWPLTEFPHGVVLCQFLKQSWYIVLFLLTSGPLSTGIHPAFISRLFTLFYY